MEILLPDNFQNIYILFQKRQSRIIKLDIKKNNNGYELEICQFIGNKKEYIKRKLILLTLSSINIDFNKNKFKINISDTEIFNIKNKNGFVYFNRIISNYENLKFFNFRQKTQKINEKTFLYFLKEKYEPKYDFQFIINNLNLINNNEIICGKRENNTFAFYLKIKKNDKLFNFSFNNQDDNGNWWKKIEYSLNLLDEKLHLKFHKSKAYFCLTINDQKTFIIPLNFFFNLNYFDIVSSIHEAIVMLPDEEQVIFNDQPKKPIRYWIDKKRYDDKISVFQFIYFENKSQNLEILRKNYQVSLAEKWDLNKKINNFSLYNLNPIKKILYFSRGYGRHRFGWDYVCKEVFLKYMADDPEGLLLDPFIEATFLWKMKISQGDFYYNKPWIGFVHSSPTTPVWYNSSNNSLMDLINNKNFKRSLPNCKGLIVLSNHLKNELDYRLKYLHNISIPIFNIYHPSGKPTKIFNINNYEKDSVLHIGLHLRNFGSFYLLDKSLKKYLIVPTEINWKDDVYYFIFEEIKKSILDFEITIDDFKKEINCFEKHNINDNEYDNLLSKHILFCDFYDSSANNLIVECIMSQTPILVNKNPAIIEYLGDEYPFYFNDIEDANKKLKDEELIIKTFNYLKSRQNLISINSFKEKWADITNKLETLIT